MSNYYKPHDIEAWDLIEYAMKYYRSDIDGSEAFYIGNILKYLLRFKYKGQRNSDLNKIQMYCERLKDEETT